MIIFILLLSCKYNLFIALLKVFFICSKSFFVITYEENKLLNKSNYIRNFIFEFFEFFNLLIHKK